LKLTYDRQADSLVLRLRNGPIHHREEVEPGVSLLFDADSGVIGVQFERARSRMPLEELITVAYENAETSKRASLKLP
jgi:uncharacterized protein YuzE